MIYGLNVPVLESYFEGSECVAGGRSTGQITAWVWQCLMMTFFGLREMDKKSQKD